MSDGEKPTKYHLNLENRHFISKQMFKLVNEQGNTITKDEDMLEETRMFYEKLYKKNEVEDIDLNEYVGNIPKLNEDESQALEGLITKEEVKNAIKKMKNGKSPGTDGITIEFIKFFWLQIGDLIVRSLNDGFMKNKMSVTQREGVIVCLPKGEKPREFLKKNWRPITLLNVIYKIGSACIANRIKQVLPQLISEDQTGFVPGRYIGDNIRLIYDMIEYLENNTQPGLLVSIDFEKAFDSVDWVFMNKVLLKFGFGNDIIKWVKAFYTDIKSYVMVNGKPSRSIKIERGCRQGDPISPYLFILCAEILGCKIRAEHRIKGITVGLKEFKITQFADDTSCFLRGDKQSFEILFETLDRFAAISGLKLNIEKNTNVWLGSERNCNTRWLTQHNMSWNPEKIKILGIIFQNEVSKVVELNLNDKYEEVKRLFGIWIKRVSTPIGRVVILKSLILSKLIYLWIMLPNPPDKFIKDLQKLCFEFVWDKKEIKSKET